MRDEISRFRVPPGRRVRLADYDPAWDGGARWKGLGRDEIKRKARRIVDRRLDDLREAQELLFASDTHAVLVVLQAMDAAGKDGMIKHVMSGMNPSGCQVFSFKRPSDEELDHDFLWRYARSLPERGRIGIFNRSYYEEALIVRVRPEILAARKLPPGPRGASFWKARFEDINAFERHLVRSGTRVLKLFLHISKREQGRRLLDRLRDPEKHWKFSEGDLAERALWGRYRRAYEDALSATSTPWAPWHVIPADRKWVGRAVAAEILARAIRSLRLSYPSPSPEKRKALARARRTLAREGIRAS